MPTTEERVITQILAAAKVEIKDGFIVSASDAAGSEWDSAEGVRMRNVLRRLTHLIVMGAAVVPASITLASAHPATAAHTRLVIKQPESALASVVVKEAVQPVPLPPPPPPPPPAVAEAAVTPLAAGGMRGQFPWGYCTWYVSSRRNIPWSGNAGQWYAAARALGFEVGATARPGAIMVSGEGAVGHVAIVESVDGNSFTISEMNFRGFGVINQRHLVLGQVRLIGFIY